MPRTVNLADWEPSKSTFPYSTYAHYFPSLHSVPLPFSVLILSFAPSNPSPPLLFSNHIVPYLLRSHSPPIPLPSSAFVYLNLPSLFTLLHSPFNSSPSSSPYFPSTSYSPPPKVHTRRLEWDSNLRSSGRKKPNVPLSHHAQRYSVLSFNWFALWYLCIALPFAID